MPVQRFRTKPVEIDAIQFTGSMESVEEINRWTGDYYFIWVDPEDRVDNPEFTAQVFDILHNTWIGVKPGQWIVRGAKGEFYPCDDETFHWKYEEVDSPLVFRKPDYGVANNE